MTNFDLTSMDEIMDIESHNIYRLARRLGFSKKYAWKMIRRSSRDNARTPMQWDRTRNAGFTSGPSSWIRVNGNYPTINVEAEQADAGSVLSFYKQLIDLRKDSPLLKEGSFRAVSAKGGLFVYERQITVSSGYEQLSKSVQSIFVLLNFSKKSAFYLCQGEVLLSNCDRSVFDGSLAPYEGILLKTERIVV